MPLQSPLLLWWNGTSFPLICYFIQSYSLTAHPFSDRSDFANARLFFLGKRQNKKWMNGGFPTPETKIKKCQASLPTGSSDWSIQGFPRSSAIAPLHEGLILLGILPSSCPGRTGLCHIGEEMARRLKHRVSFLVDSIVWAIEGCPWSALTVGKALDIVPGLTASNKWLDLRVQRPGQLVQDELGLYMWERWGGSFGRLYRLFPLPFWVPLKRLLPNSSLRKNPKQSRSIEDDLSFPSPFI